MLTKRVIPCLDVKDGRVVKGVNFVSLRDAGDPVELARAYDHEGADEVVFLDITATSDNRATTIEMAAHAAEELAIPYTVGGGFRGAVADGSAPEQAGGPWVDGLGIMRGSCTRLESSRLKVPHVGWDQVRMTPAGAADPLLAGFAEGANMYFTHSYAVADDADAADVLARTHYTRSFPCIVRHGNVWGCQFHPEKSSALGQRILKNFVSIVEEVGR